MTERKLSIPSQDVTNADADDSLKEGKDDNFAKYKTVAKRLEAIFGTGDNPQLRRQVYMKIQKCAIEHGPECYDVIRAAVQQAQAADFPDRYFMAAVTRELKVLEYWERPVDF